MSRVMREARNQAPHTDRSPDSPPVQIPLPRRKYNKTPCQRYVLNSQERKTENKKVELEKRRYRCENCLCVFAGLCVHQ